MGKKRGVLISAINRPHTIAKSQSAHTHPGVQAAYGQTQTQPQNHLTQSNLLSEEPQRMVNQAYYTYQDPDAPRLQYSDRSEDQNEGQAIESMQKRQQELLRQKREEEKVKQVERAKSSKPKQMSTNRTKGALGDLSKPTPRRQSKELPLNQQKPVKLQGEHKRKQTKPAILKPKPLVFSVNMFSKGSPRPPNEDAIINKLSQRIQQRSHHPSHPQSIWDQSSGMSLNCRRLPFRFSGVI